MFFSSFRFTSVLFSDIIVIGLVVAIGFAGGFTRKCLNGDTHIYARNCSMYSQCIKGTWINTSCPDKTFFNCTTSNTCQDCVITFCCACNQGKVGSFCRVNGLKMASLDSNKTYCECHDNTIKMRRCPIFMHYYSKINGCFL